MGTATQVIIIGAGPTGLALACQLHRYNIDFLILDKNSRTTHLSKAMVVHARTLEIFDETGLAERAVAMGQIASEFKILSKGKIKGSMSIGAFGEGLSPYPFALVLEQSKTENLLAAYLSEHGKSIQWDSEFVRFEETADGVTAYYKTDGRELSVNGKYLVGCDGAASPIRHQLGYGFEGDTQERNFYVADVKVVGEIAHGNYAYFVMIDKGFVLFFPMEGEQHYRIIGTVPGAIAGKEKVRFHEIAESLRREMMMPVDFVEEFWFSTYKVHSRLAASFGKGRCLIAGDAAHIHTPAGGQGMNTGIQDAYNLGWKLAFIINGHGGQQLLNSYDVERRGNAKNLLRTTDRMFDLLAGTGPLTNFFRLYLFPTIIGFVTKLPFINKRIFPTLSQIGISYPDSPLTVKSSLGSIKAGDRMPYFEVGGQSIYRKLAAPGCTLLYFGSNDRTGEIAFPPNITIISFIDVPKPFRGHIDFYIALRPDNYIAYIGKDATEAAGALQKIFSIA